MSHILRRSHSRPVIDFYASGLLHTEKDFLGVTLVGANPGIIAAAKVGSRLKYEDKVPAWIQQHLVAGGKLFCDSGAFTVAFTGKVMDFNKVFRFYHQLLKLCRDPAQLILVMPDSVGEQARTIKLWEDYTPGIAWWLRRGCVCLFPMQGYEYTMKAPGQLSLPEMYDLACSMFGKKVATALPMKKAATKPEAALAFVKATKPPHLHLLGMGRKEESVQLAIAMTRASPDTVLTADAVETTTAYGGRHYWMTPAALEKIDLREKAKGGKRRDIWYRDRVSDTDDEEVNWWLPTAAMGEHWQDRFEGVVQEMVVDALSEGTITENQAEHALRSPAYARKLFAKEFKATNAVMAMADHMMHRMRQTPVPRVSDIR